LNAGDLSLNFRRGKAHVSLRQIALAQLALGRMPLEKWLAQQQQSHNRTHRTDAISPASLAVNGRRLDGFLGHSLRRRRFFWARDLPKRITTLALHDSKHD